MTRKENRQHRQEKTLAQIIKAPRSSFREIMRISGAGSTSVVARDVRELEFDGYIHVTDNQARSLELTYSANDLDAYARRWDADAAALGNPHA